MRRYRAAHWRYSVFDGSQEPLLPGADDILGALGDDLLYHGDLHAALREAMQSGFNGRDGTRYAGLRELLEQLRERREALRERFDPDGMVEEIQRELEEIVGLERRALEANLDATSAAPEPDAARQQAAERLTELDLMPPGLNDRIAALREHEFASREANERFDALLERLRGELAQMHLDRTAGALAGMGEAEREHLRNGLDALNRMLEQRAAGEETDPSFEQFMSEFGDLFPGDPGDLDELLSQLGRRMAAASQIVASMSPAQQAALAELTNELLGDIDLSWQLDRLGSNLRDAFPEMGFDTPLDAYGETPLGLGEAAALADELSALDELESVLSQAADPARLAEVDLERARELLGRDAARAIEALAELTRRLEQAGLIARREGRLVLTPEGLRRLGARALSELFSSLQRDRLGDHALAGTGIGHDRDTTTRPYEFGDPFNVHIGETIRAAVRRQAATGGGTIELPIRLHIDDFAIEQREQIASASTVLCLDCSLSMPMRDNFLPAKKVAIALQALIASRYPRDYLGLVAFSATAREVRPEELPELSWDFAYGTNLEHALLTARRMLANRSGARQIIVVTDGEPTAHIEDDGEVFFAYPPVRETIDRTLSEVLRCTRERIVINTFVLDETGGLRAFVEQMTRINRGRTFSTTPQSLGDYVLVDFVRERAAARRRVRRGA